MSEIDPTEPYRRELQDAISATPREEIAAGQSWTTDQLREDFTVISFLAPYVHVERKADKVRGTLLFKPSAEGRLYFGFEPA